MCFEVLGIQHRSPRILMQAWEVFSQWMASLQSRNHHCANASETWTGLEMSTDLRLVFMLIMANTETYSFQQYKVSRAPSPTWECWAGKWCHLLKQSYRMVSTASSFWRMRGVYFLKKYTSRGLWDDSAGKGVQHQNWWPQGPHGGRQETFSMCMIRLPLWTFKTMYI